MGFYRDRVFPRIVDVAGNTNEKRRIRAKVCAPLAGELLEIGFGTGLNLAHLPPSVSRLFAVDPLKRGRELARARLAESHVLVDFVGLDGQSIELADDCVDTALSTWTLCSIADPRAAVREIARVLRPGGIFQFAEHGRAPDSNVRKWQDRLNGMQRRVACGCNLNRDIPAIIEDAGMTITSLETFYAKGEPRFVGWTYEGSARVRADAAHPSASSDR